MANRKILYIVNSPEYFVSHRFDIAKQALFEGYTIDVASEAKSVADESAIRKISEAGFTYHHLPIKRGGQNPFLEVISLLKTYVLIRKLVPSIVHLVTIKPIIYGGVAARVLGIDRTVSAIAGLGTIFLGRSFFSKIRKVLVTFMLRMSLGAKKSLVIFQNPDDRDVLTKSEVLTTEQARIIRGSGVTLDDYPYTPEPKGVPVIVMAARLIKDKGVFEFVEAAKLLKQRGVDIKMRLIGSPDSCNPTSVTQKLLERWRSESYVEMMGYRNDIAYQYAAANVICLPSYREGLPKSLVEAAACGRAVVTTDVPGCRDAIIPDETGLLVPVRDSKALADAIQNLVENPELRDHMGKAGRKLAEEVFTIENIVSQHMEIYEELMKA